MASDEHLGRLDDGAHAWGIWRADPNLTTPNLRGARLSKRPLDHFDFRGADLADIDATGSSLRYVRLSGANLERANFSDADLSFADLSNTVLSPANLSGANLYRSNLNGCTLTGANLKGASFKEAQIVKARFDRAALQGADLTRATLDYSSFTGADLRNADLTGASVVGVDLARSVVGGTMFIDLAIGGARGLAEIEHKTRSAVSIETLYLSAGKIPDVFLRGVGLEEDFITYSRGFFNRAIEFYSCFISYSHKDKSFALRLHDQLQGQGIRCWLDEHQLLPGDDIYEQVDRGIKLWDKVLLCCSRDSLASWWVDNEIESAFEKERALMKRDKRKRLALIPLNLDGFMFSKNWRSGKSQQVRSRLAADFTGWEVSNRKFEEQFERLVKALKTLDGGREQPPDALL